MATLNGKEINQKKNGTHIVYEAGPTHYGIESAKELVDMAVEAGSDSVKFQMTHADRLMADKSVMFSYDYLKRDADGKESFVKKEEPLVEILRRRELNKEEWIELKAHCDAKGIHFFSTATFKDDVDFLVDELKVDSIKIASGDVNDLEFIRYAAGKGINIQLDTGGADIWEIERAVIEAEDVGCDNIIIHLCPSGYPTHYDSIHLNMLATLRQMFPTHSIAFSDHSPGGEVDIAAVALGADMVEKTITLDRTIESCEHSFSLEKDAAIEFIKMIRRTEQALGDSRRTIPKDVREKRKNTRRSPYALKALNSGDVIVREDFEFKRPGFGITSEEFEFFIGKTLTQDVNLGEAVTYDKI